MGTYALVIAAVILVIDLYAGARTQREEVDRIRRDLTTRARLAAAHAVLRLGQGGPPDAVADSLGLLSGVRVTLIDRSGAVIGDSEVEGSALAGVENHAGRPEVREALAGGVGSAVRRSATVGVDLLYVALLAPDTLQAVRVVRLAAPLTDVQKVLDQIHNTLLIASLWGLLLSLVLCYGASYVISRPIRAMTSVARDMAGGDFSARAHAPSSDELDSLARALNEMSAQLKARIEQITEEKSLLEAVLASATEGILVTDEHGAVLSANAALRGLFQAPPSSPVAGRPSIEVVRNPEVQEAIERTLRSGEETVREVALLGPAERRLEAHFTPIRLHGGIIGSVGIFYDVTEMRRMERMRRDFVANVSHELRTPLTAIRGCAETLADGALDDRDAARRFVGTIRSHAERLSALIDDLLSLSRIESGAQAIRRVSQPILPIVESSVQVVEAAAAQKRIDIQTDVPDGLPDIPCDGTLIEQALVNLLDNAIKYTPEGGRVRITAKKTQSDEGRTMNAPPLPESPKDEVHRSSFIVHRSGGWVEIAVEDTGIGIPPEHLPRVFERFYRVDRARSRALGGTGLGLSIVKHVAEAHGGSVRAESEVGKGSVFKILLPID
jgi:two-component system phosphate regulon sensor histidine kinase PhoR